MSDLISRQDAIEAVGSMLRRKFGIGGDLAEITLAGLPPAEPEIIRCRDCKHWDKTWSNNWSPDYHYCPVIDEVRKGNFHCRYAERRKDE